MFLKPKREVCYEQVCRKRDVQSLGKRTETELAEQGPGSIVIVDSVTHIYEQMCREIAPSIGPHATYEPLRDSKKAKPLWARSFVMPVTEAKNAHVIFTGRAAWQYAYEQNEETGKRDFYQSGVKMRGDAETAHEADLLVLMERLEQPSAKGMKVYREAFVMKDRSTLIDGKRFRNPTFKNFQTVYQFLCQGGEKEPAKETSLGIVNPCDWTDRTRQQTIFLEEIKGYFDSYFPGATKEEKKIKADIAQVVFDTRSWEAIGRLHPEELRKGKVLVERLCKAVTDAKEDPAPAGEFLSWLQGIKVDLQAEIEADLFAAATGGATKEDDVPIDWEDAPTAQSPNGNGKATGKSTPIDKTGQMGLRQS